MSQPTEEKPISLNVKTSTTSENRLCLFAHDTTFIKNIVYKVQGYGTISGEEIRSVFISANRVCIELKNNVEFSIQIKGGNLYD